MQILVVEDEPTVQTLISATLEKQNYKPILTNSLASAREVDQEEIDAAVVDLGLPDGNGFDLCKELRKDQVTIPILVLSGTKDANIKVQCLNAGVDDYITKPFDPSELVARINAISRRWAAAEGNVVITGGELTLNKIERSFRIKNNNVPLTNNEINLLAYLMEREGEIVSRDKISADLWNIDFQTPSNFVNVYISYLRKKIREHASHEYIKTIRNEGFVFVPPNGEFSKSK